MPAGDNHGRLMRWLHRKKSATYRGESCCCSTGANWNERGRDRGRDRGWVYSSTRRYRNSLIASGLFHGA